MSRRPGDGRGDTLERLSLGAYRVLRLRYPGRLRREYGEEMEEAFRALLRERRRAAGGLRGAASAWWRVLRDLTRALPGPVTRPTAPPGAMARRGKGPMRAWRRDLHVALRSLARDPRFTAVVVGVLGLGVALNAMVFSVMNAYLIRPLPYPIPERLYSVRGPGAPGWMDVGDVFERAVSWDLDAFTLVGDAGPELTLGAWVTPDFFDLYGVRPFLGRALRPEEAGSGAAAVAVVSHRLWQARFGGDPAVLGRTFRAFTSDRPDDAETFTIVGVLPADFWHFNSYTDVLAPLRRNQAVYAGRLRADVPPERAEELLTRLGAGQADAGLPPDFRIRLLLLQDAYGAAVRPPILVTQAAALLVLLIACANAGILILLRATRREGELALRRALGAAGGRLALPLVVEGLALAAAAGLVGVAVASAGLSGVGEVVEARLDRGIPGGVAALRLDRMVLGAGVALCAGIGLAFGSLPLWTSARRNLSSLLSAASRGSTETVPARRLRGFLVGAEVALSLTLLTGAALLVRSALHLHARPLGFDPAGLVRGQVGLRQGSYPDDETRIAFFDALLERARAIPGVSSAGIVRAAPFSGDLTGWPVEAEEGDATVAEAVPQVVSPGYLTTIGTAVVRGRDFLLDDGPGSMRVALASESLAGALWPSVDPLGRRVRFSGGDPHGATDREAGPWLTIVGVVPDVVMSAGEDRPVVYAPYRQATSLWMSLVLRARPGATRVVDGVEEVLRGLDPDAPLFSVARLDEAVARAAEPSRFFAGLMGVFSAFAFLLTVVGLYGVVAYAARQRRRDVAIRIALGGHGRAVEGLFVRQALWTVGIALVLGMAGGRLLGGALRDQLHGVDPADPATGVTAALVVALTAVAAVWIPARRAGRADPMGALREE